ncbi:DUF4202 domain-containing protein [Methylogaea oryzae]|uniref:DUF4202 domain-containing protein n=1 Tax=Methylogaea oryzae TaxID=1295382 RepID=A0A8D4VQI0_9GAMM|nr:DUF4202 domain-containing protein [Methylogaea oryzae]BBL71402.1 hypothetical protein MoryE10_20080 [Methylogaea oryzae]
MVVSENFGRAIALIDAANGEDPNRESWQGREWPKELLYSQRMSEWLERLAPDADEAVRLAARAQHIRRWMVPRDSYPKTREGYLRWRTGLYEFHAETAGALLAQAGYGEETVERVGRMLRKRGLKREADTQLIEDVACLVFLEHYFGGFAPGHDEAKVVDIVRKTWKKMSDTARQAALGLNLSDDVRRLVALALAEA